MPPFRPLAQHELERLGDDELIAYIHAARRADDRSAGDALATLVFGHRHNVRRRVAMKVPDADVEDLTDDIVADAIVSAFDGTSGGQFGSWLNTITQRAIADYHRRGPGRFKRGELDRETEAPREHAVEALDAVDRVLAPLSDEHRRVIGLWLLGFRAAEIDGVSDDNVHQIVSRFRRALRGQLGGEENGEAT